MQKTLLRTSGGSTPYYSENFITKMDIILNIHLFNPFYVNNKSLIFSILHNNELA